MLSALAAVLAFSAGMAALACHLQSPGLRRVAAILCPLLMLGVAASQGNSPGVRAVWATLGLLYAFKATVLLQLPAGQVAGGTRLGLALYLTLWPGMDPQPLLRRRPSIEGWERLFVAGWIRLVTGGACIIALAGCRERLGPAADWAGVAAFLLALHLGYIQVLAALLQGLGFPVQPLFREPWRARTLNDFWSHRWNLAFVQLNRLVFMRPLRRQLGIRGAVGAAFLISGLLHEGALSYPCGSGWGGPTLYFCLQAALVALERRLKLKGRVWVFGCLFLPLPILFHAGARQLWIGWPLEQLSRLLGPQPLRWFLPAAGWGHFLVLAASFQVPTRLRWHEELPRLSPFNRKLMWTYGVFIVLNIVSFGLLTLALGQEMLRGDRAALHLAALIAVFWSLRIGVDALYFEHSDWPGGPAFVVGHCLLTTLFVSLASVYWLLLLTHV